MIIIVIIEKFKLKIKYMIAKAYFIKFLRHSVRVVAMINENTPDVRDHFPEPEPLMSDFVSQ